MIHTPRMIHMAVAADNGKGVGDVYSTADTFTDDPSSSSSSSTSPPDPSSSSSRPRRHRSPLLCARHARLVLLLLLPLGLLATAAAAAGWAAHAAADKKRLSNGVSVAIGVGVALGVALGFVLAFAGPWWAGRRWLMKRYNNSRVKPLLLQTPNTHIQQQQQQQQQQGDHFTYTEPHPRTSLTITNGPEPGTLVWDPQGGPNPGPTLLEISLNHRANAARLSMEAASSSPGQVPYNSGPNPLLEERGGGEVRDPTWDPTGATDLAQDLSQVLGLAAELGLDLTRGEGRDKDLMLIAWEAWRASLPTNWCRYVDNVSGRVYYGNAITRESTWRHPLEQEYRTRVVRVRAERDTTTQQPTQHIQHTQQDDCEDGTSVRTTASSSFATDATDFSGSDVLSMTVIQRDRGGGAANTNTHNNNNNTNTNIKHPHLNTGPLRLHRTMSALPSVRSTHAGDINDPDDNININNNNNMLDPMSTSYSELKVDNDNDGAGPMSMSMSMSMSLPLGGEREGANASLRNSWQEAQRERRERQEVSRWRQRWQQDERRTPALDTHEEGSNEGNTSPTTDSLTESVRSGNTRLQSPGLSPLSLPATPPIVTELDAWRRPLVLGLPEPSPHAWDN